jgi:hypothetical protein
MLALMPSNCLQPRTAAEWLADAERYEAWAMRTAWNEELSSKFRRLGAEARTKAAVCRA